MLAQPTEFPEDPKFKIPPSFPGDQTPNHPGTSSVPSRHGGARPLKTTHLSRRGSMRQFLATTFAAAVVLSGCAKDATNPEPSELTRAEAIQLAALVGVTGAD